MSSKKLTVIGDIAKQLEEEGISLAPSVIRTRLYKAMRELARESCLAFGIERDDDEIDKMSSSRAFHEAIASILNDEEDNDDPRLIGDDSQI